MAGKDSDTQSDLIRGLISIARQAIKHESMTQAGIVNLFGMLGMFLLGVAFAVSGAAVGIADAFADGHGGQLPLAQLVYCFFGFMILCVLFLGVADYANRKRR